MFCLPCYNFLFYRTITLQPSFFGRCSTKLHYLSLLYSLLLSLQCTNSFIFSSIVNPLSEMLNQSMFSLAHVKRSNLPPRVKCSSLLLLPGHTRASFAYCSQCFLQSVLVNVFYSLQCLLACETVRGVKVLPAAMSLPVVMGGSNLYDRPRCKLCSFSSVASLYFY